MKNLFRLLLVSVLCICLSACSGNSENNNNNDKDKDDLGNNVINEVVVTLDNSQVGWHYLDKYDYFDVTINISNADGVRDVSCGYRESFNDGTSIGSTTNMSLSDGDANNGTYSVEIKLDKNANKDNVALDIIIIDSNGGYQLTIPYDELEIIE